MKKIILLLFFVVFAFCGQGQVVYQWANGIGSSGVDYGNSITTDVFGNVYVTGSFSSTADFDPSVNVATLTSHGNYDIFVAKYDANGNYVWAINMGGTSFDGGYSITTDIIGNVYITGFFQGTVDFDPSAATATLASSSLGNRDIFIAKYDSNGNYVWAKGIGGTGIDYGFSISTDTLGNVFVSGEFEFTVDFDPSSNINTLTSTGGSDIFIAKYDTNGNYVWAKNMGGSIHDVSFSENIDVAGNIYITGYFQNTADFDPSINAATIVSTGNGDIFVAKYDSNGNYAWAKSMGGSGFDYGNSITTDKFGNVYVTGGFESTADFDPSVATVMLTSNGNYDIFVAKYDANGNYVWAKNMGSSGFDAGNSITTDTMGNVYVTGYFQNTVDFNPSATTNTLASLGSRDIFIARYNTNGNYVWAKNMGGTGFDFGNAITIDIYGDVYVTGSFSDIADFDPSVNTATLISAGDYDIFIAKYTQTISCIAQIVSNPQNICAGNDYTIGNSTYTASGIYTDTLQSIFGCDSIVVTQLTVKPSYMVNNPQSICAGSSYIFNNHTYTVTGTYNDTLQTVLGCDSIIVTQLTVNNLPVINFVVSPLYNNFYLCQGELTTFYAVGANTYTWVVNGANAAVGNSMTIVPISTFSLFVTGESIDGCVGSSQVVQFYVETDCFLSIKEPSSNQINISVYPNPASEILNVECEMMNNETELQIINILGELIKRSTLTTKHSQIDVSSLMNGIYFVVVSDQEKRSVTKKLIIVK